MLDTQLHIVAFLENQKGDLRRPAVRQYGLSRRSRRVFSRALMGVKKAGRYYFLTLTSSPQSPDVKESWKKIREWLREYRSKSCHLHVITSEGCGVIHIIIRLGKEEKRIEIKKLREYWKKIHQASQIKIIKIYNKEDVVKYIADQSRKKSMAAEMAWQDGIVSWGWSKGWLPKGFVRHFGRFWYRSRDAGLEQQERFLHGWLMRCFEDEQEILSPPAVRKVGQTTRSLDAGGLTSFSRPENGVKGSKC